MFPKIVVGAPLDEIRSKLAAHPSPVERLFIQRHTHAGSHFYEKEAFYEVGSFRHLRPISKFFLDNFFVAETHGHSTLRVCKMDYDLLIKTLEMSGLLQEQAQKSTNSTK